MRLVFTCNFVVTIIFGVMDLRILTFMNIPAYIALSCVMIVYERVPSHESRVLHILSSINIACIFALICFLAYRQRLLSECRQIMKLQKSESCVKEKEDLLNKMSQGLLIFENIASEDQPLELSMSAQKLN